MKTKTLILLSLVFIGCQEEEIAPVQTQCDCHELHEVLEPTVQNGEVVLDWVYEFETDPLPMDCANATGWQTDGGDKRWKTICQ